MEDGLLSLKWNNHKTTFFEILRLLRDKASYTDATLFVDGKFYPVHKLVLSTCSEYFSEIFERCPCKSPVVVLKDVRCEDLESLLDYMYIGEVNVNQNDLALLLKTAECLRIKGLAVPDDDTTRHSSASSKVHMLNKDDVVKDTPPSKRRRQDSSSAPSALSPPRISPATLIPASPSHTSSSSHPHKTATESCSPRGDAQQHDIPLVKVEIEDTEGEAQFPSDNCDDSVDPEKRDYIEKSEHDPSGYPNANFSTQNTADMQWEEDGENSFPPDSYGGDASSQHAGGDDDDEEVDVTTLSPLNNFGNLPLTQTKEARRCQLCQVMLANSNLLRRHVEDHHFHIRKYDCVHCGKKFKRKEHRERHERIHTGEKPFACHICSSRFTQKEHLKGHIENVHIKHMREKDDPKIDLKNDSKSDQETEREVASSSPPSLASPSSLQSFMASSMSSLLSTMPLSHLSHLSHIFPSGSSPSAILPSAPSTSSEGSGGDNKNLVTALYAPVSRNAVESPNRHFETITINFN